MTPHPKILTTHLARHAYIYVRQSTLRQVLHATESKERQYGLGERAFLAGNHIGFVALYLVGQHHGRLFFTIP